jgi:KDO2-lipid IV(A) lauroyltransferase
MRNLWKGLGRGFVGAAARLLVRPVRRRSLQQLRPLARRLAWLARTLAPARQKMARENMALVLPERYQPRDYRRLSAQATYNLVLTGLELLKLPALTPPEIQAASRLEGLEHLQQALARGVGCLMLTAHFGSWELGGAALALAGIPMSVIGSYSSRGALLVNEAREALGIQVIEADDLRGMLRALRQGRCLAILPDLSHLARNSIVVEFMGRPALTAVGVALMAQRTGCPVVPAFSVREPDGACRVRVFPALDLARTDSPEQDLRANTALFNRVIGDQIAAHPDQWLWLHNRWKFYESFMPPAAEKGSGATFRYSEK